MKIKITDTEINITGEKKCVYRVGTFALFNKCVRDLVLSKLAIHSSVPTVWLSRFLMGNKNINYIQPFTNEILTLQ